MAIQRLFSPRISSITHWSSRSAASMADLLLGDYYVQRLCSKPSSGVNRVNNAFHEYVALIEFAGFPLSFGVFQSYYSQLPQFRRSPFITYVGTIATGIPYLGAPLMVPLVKRYPKYQRPMIWLGWTICISGLVAGSFAATVTSLVMTQGVMYGGQSRLPLHHTVLT